MNIVFNVIVTHLIALNILKSKKKKKKDFASSKPTKVLSWTLQGLPLGFVQYVGDIPLEILLKWGD